MGIRAGYSPALHRTGQAEPECLRRELHHAVVARREAGVHPELPNPFAGSWWPSGRRGTCSVIGIRRSRNVQKSFGNYLGDRARAAPQNSGDGEAEDAAASGISAVGDGETRTRALAEAAGGRRTDGWGPGTGRPPPEGVLVACPLPGNLRSVDVYFADLCL